MSIQLELDTQILSSTASSIDILLESQTLSGSSSVELVLEPSVITVETDLSGGWTATTGLTGATGPTGPAGPAGAYADLTGLPTLPSSTIVGISDTQTLTNKTVTDASFAIQDDLDNTKKAVFQCSGITTGNTLTYTFPAASGTLIIDTGAQGIGGVKTFTSATQNVGSAIVASTNNFAYGATTTGVTKTVNIGTAGLSGSTTNISIGSAVSGALGTTTLNQTTVLGSTIQLKNYTVATLPTAGTAGRRAYVTDAYMPTFLGALISGPRTNLMFPSNAITGWAASPANCVAVTANAATSPDGTTNATKLATNDIVSNSHVWYKTYAGAINTAYCASVYFKSGEYSRAQFAFDNSGYSTTTGALFDLANGTVVATGGGSTATITLVGNGWYRCSITGTSDADGGNYVVSLTPVPASITTFGAGYTPASTGLGVYVYGVQVETGSIATTYVPTTTAAATGTAVTCPVFDNGTAWVSG